MADENVEEQELVIEDQDLFNEALKPQSTEPKVEAKAPEPTAEQPRDESGRFAPKDAEPDKAAAPPVVTPPVTPTEPPKAAEPDDRRIPLSEHLNEREKRQQFQREAEQLRQQVQQMQSWYQQEQQRQQQPPQQIDPFVQPTEFFQQQVNPLRTEAQQMFQQQKEDFSQLLAVQQYGQQAVDTAAAELKNFVQTNPQWQFEAQRILASKHPFGEIVAWHKQQQTQKEIGTDPAAYKTRLMAELLADPAFQAQAIEAARRGTQQPQPGRPATAPNVVLPPSLSSMTSSAGREVDSPGTDDQSLYRFATSR